MNKPPLHPKEQDRLQSLHAHKILDTGQDQAFDDLIQLASQLFDVPIALVSLVDEDRQWFKACVGLDLKETGRDVSFCGHAICSDETFVVEDAAKDERFSDNPLVTQADGIRFYAGAKVCDGSGLPLGTLCLIDHKPHTFSEEQQQQLEQLARQAGRQLALHRLLADLSHASDHDELTGLLNRRGLLAEIDQASVESDQIQAVVYLDVKRFKSINDAYGLAAGDQILEQIADRLQQAVSQMLRHANGTTAQIARIGGDEFVAILCTRHLADWVQHTFAQALCEAMDEPFTCNNQAHYLGARAGVMTSLPGQRLEASQALSNADIALHQAKHLGHHVMRFDHVMREQIALEMQIETRLREAVVTGGITAAFEPILDLHTGKVCGFEALARWNDPELGRVRPDQFIPIAERAGLIDRVFQAVASQALTVCKAVTTTVQQDLWFSVNLSKAQLTDDRLFDQLIDLTNKHSIDPGRMHLEVTESLVASCDGMIDKLHRLRKLGHPLMLDDFGSGTSSLSCLKAYPVQWIKIDRQLTDAADKSLQYASIIQAVADLATNLGMNLVAEGVEEADTIPLLQSMEVAAAQGWYWSKPLEPGQVANWLIEHNRRGDTQSRVA
ncbi:MAG: sensor domain-containing phosphodiesterase [Phycisphaeraceae bacterium]|nr:sensor domain-containing phosphodiesterase [Phycisphaeraceae bacterium]